jgi:hypothetical protein
MLLVQLCLLCCDNVVPPDSSGCSITLLTDDSMSEFRKFCQLFNLRFHLFNDFLIWPFRVFPHSFIFLPFYFLQLSFGLGMANLSSKVSAYDLWRHKGKGQMTLTVNEWELSKLGEGGHYWGHMVGRGMSILSVIV